MDLLPGHGWVDIERKDTSVIKTKVIERTVEALFIFYQDYTKKLEDLISNGRQRWGQ